jgi:hypothetical protein
LAAARKGRLVARISGPARSGGALVLGLAILAFPAAAQENVPPQRTINIEVYGSDPCPPVTGEEIVVCARKPEKERYRIPKELREDPDRRPDEVSWGSRVAEMEEVNRPTMPGSCSVVGSGGHTGCFQQMMRAWNAERNARRR